MSDVEITYKKQQVTREETAHILSALAQALADAGKVELALGHTSMTVHVPGEVQCKVEVEIDRDEVEFEVELRWSTARGEGPRQPEASAEHHGDSGNGDDDDAQRDGHADAPGRRATTEGHAAPRRRRTAHAGPSA